MKRNQTCFEVAVTPPYKKKAPLEPSPILILEKFKGSPSLLFKDVKVGSTVSKGFWAENPNNCTVTVVLAKLPPAERGLSFSESEFVLDAGCSRRIDVEWTPTGEGSWRDIIKVEVWGLPPPHLSFRVILHLTSVQPKVKRKCCHMALKPQNARSSKAKTTSSVPNPPSSCCNSHPPSKAVNGKGKENVAKRQPIERKLTKRPTSIDRDSLENTPPGLPSIEFVSVDDGVLPPCDVPSTPVRRNTYCIESVESDASSNPLHITDTVFEENGEELPSSVEKRGQRFLEALEEPWSPINISDDGSKEKVPAKNTLLTPATPLTTLNHRRLNQGLGQCSTEKTAMNFVSPPEANSTKILFPNKGLMEEKTKNMLIDSTPLQRPKFKYLTTPQYSPIPPVSEECITEVSVNTNAGYRVSDQRHVAEMTTHVNINHTFIKGSKSELDLEEVIRKHCSIVQRNWRQVQEEKKKEIEEGQRLVVLEKACIVIQRKWRFYLARKKARKVRADKWALMHNACCAIQRNWRYYVARKQARKDRLLMWQHMNEASSTIQRSYRRYLARKRAREDRAVMWQSMNEAASVIQRCFRFHLARKQAREDRAVMLQLMNEASSVIQRSFKLYLARKKARHDRAVMLQHMNEAASVIQRSFKLYVARTKARQDRAVMLQRMNEASSVIQRSFKLYLARKKARLERAVIWQHMHEAASVIQRSFKLYLARKKARLDRAVMLQLMNKASSTIQRGFRQHLARRKAREDRAVMWQSMNEAACVIQRSWRLYLARKIAARERAEMWMMMQDASCVIQKSWRSYVARKQAARERAEILESIKRKYECADDKNKREDAVKPEKCLFEILEKFHLKPRAYELLFELADLHPSENLYFALMHIQNGIRNRKLKLNKSILQCDKATQTLANGELVRPVTKSQINVSSTRTSSRLSTRRSLLESQHRKSLMNPTPGFLTPLTVNGKKRDVPEKERWSSVAEAVGRINFTPQK